MSPALASPGFWPLWWHQQDVGTWEKVNSVGGGCLLVPPGGVTLDRLYLHVYPQPLGRPSPHSSLLWLTKTDPSLHSSG